VHYHVGNANVVADALSHKAHCNYLPAVSLTREESYIRVLPDLSLYNITVTTLLREEIIAAQKNDEDMAHLRRRFLEGDSELNCFQEDAEGTLWFKDRLVVPKKKRSRRRYLTKLIHRGTPFILGAPNMYHDLRQQFWWTRMKREIARYVSKCDTCRKVKADYMKSGGLLQPRSIPD
jgi:hypothetical protein